MLDTAWHWDSIEFIQHFFASGHWHSLLLTKLATKILKASSVFSGPGHVEQLRLRICGTRGFASYNWVGGRVFAAKMVWRFEFEADPSQKLGQSFSPFPNLFLLFSTGHLRDEIVIWTTFEDHKHWVIFKHFLPAAMPYNSKRFSHVGYSNN